MTRNYVFEFFPRTFRDVGTYVPKGACVEKSKIAEFCPKGAWGAKWLNTTATRAEDPKPLTDKNTFPRVPKGACLHVYTMYILKQGPSRLEKHIENIGEAKREQFWPFQYLTGCAGEHANN